MDEIIRFVRTMRKDYQKHQVRTEVLEERFDLLLQRLHQARFDLHTDDNRKVNAGQVREFGTGGF